ncbi:MAG: flagellar biosynthesis protein FliQ [Candidatus Latescibacteria bacterium]|nr:flagellar biosynthesis protein FliQ [Candidatus Latescibacterota bacterium]
MTPDQAVQIAREAMIVTLLLSAPMLGFGLVVGLIVSIFQAVTQINEMTLTFIPKIIAVALALAIFLPWLIQTIVDFTTNLFQSLPNMTM